jgi:hypothetical protein
MRISWHSWMQNVLHPSQGSIHELGEESEEPSKPSQGKGWGLKHEVFGIERECRIIVARSFLSKKVRK